MDLSVVVEVNENVKILGPSLGMRNCFGIARLFARPPQLDAVSPTVERPVIVTADVKFFRAVQANVNEIGGQIFSVWEFSGGVGKDKGDVVFAQQIEKVGRDEAFVPNFERIAQWAGDIELDPGAPFQLVIVLFGKLRRAAHRAATIRKILPGVLCSN